MKLILYNTKDDKKTANKAKQKLDMVNVHVKEFSNNTQEPTFILETKHNNPSCNYVYASEMGGRYYFVETKNRLPNGLVEYVCRCDVLESFWDQLENKITTIERQENLSSPYFVDTNYPIRGDVSVSIDKVDTLDEKYHYYITTTGGVN